MKRHLPQIKVFGLTGNDETDKNIVNEVNQYVIDKFNETGNEPEIHQSGNFISVICRELFETNYQVKPPKPFKPFYSHPHGH